MEDSSKIYNHYPKFENLNPIHYDNDNTNIADIENSIHASLIVNKMQDNNKCYVTPFFKILITFSFVGLMFLTGIIVVLLLKK